MFITPRSRRAALADKAGISVSIPDIIVSTMVRIVVVGGLVAAIGAMLVLSTTAKTSSSTSASFQASSLRFKADSASADFVRGAGTDTVALMTTSATGKCDIVTWRNLDTGTPADPLLNLVTQKDTVAGPCTLTTAIPAASATGRNLLLSNVSANVITYKNVAGRVITFDAAGTATLAPGAVPAGTLAEDWNDVRPQRMEMAIGSTSTKNTTYAKNAKLVGFTSVVNYVQAVGAQNYSKPGSSVVEPGARPVVRVERSVTTGAMYSGAREGIRVSFKNGLCVALDGSTSPTFVKVVWTPTAPSGLSPVTDSYSAPLSGATNYRDMAGVQNGASGTVDVNVSCTPAATPLTGTKAYSQPVPRTVLTVNQNAVAEKHNLSWSPVSSLPTSFRVDWASANNQLLATPVATTTSALTAVTTQVQGTTYGFNTWYAVNPSVSGTVPVDPAVAVPIWNGWPAVPGATNVQYNNTGANGRIISGTIDWNTAGTCPAGTDRMARKVDNLRGLSNGSGEWADFNTGTFEKNLNGHTWAPWYALEGYVYGTRIDTECTSPITGAESPWNTVQSPNYITPMAQPAAPSWNGYNFAYQTLPRGGTAGWSTCRNHGGNLCGTFANGMALDFDYYCSSGSWLTWSNIPSQSWKGSWFNNRFGDLDGWELGNGSNHERAYYGNASYTCGTPWAGSPQSTLSGGFYWDVWRR